MILPTKVTAKNISLLINASFFNDFLFVVLQKHMYPNSRLFYVTALHSRLFLRVYVLLRETNFFYLETYYFLHM